MRFVGSSKGAIRFERPRRKIKGGGQGGNARTGCVMEGNGLLRRRNEWLDRQAPKSVELERELLLALLVGGDVKNLEGLHVKDFTDELHAEVFVAMKELESSGIRCLEVEPVLVQVGAGQRRDLIAVWFEKYRISHGVAANIPYYKKCLRELRRRRALIAVSCDLTKRCFDEQTPVGDTRSWLTRQLERVDQL